MKSVIGIISLLSIFVFTLPIVVAGQEASITVETSVDTLYAGIPFKLRITLENHEGSLLPPEIVQLRIIGGPNQSSSFSMINGQVNQSSSFTYILLADEPGIYKLGKASTTGGGPLLETEEIILQILPSEKGLQKENEKWNLISGDKEKKDDKPKLKTRKF
jgi:hypothetical protein